MSGIKTKIQLKISSHFNSVKYHLIYRIRWLQIVLHYWTPRQGETMISDTNITINIYYNIYTPKICTLPVKQNLKLGNQNILRANWHFLRRTFWALRSNKIMTAFYMWLYYISSKNRWLIPMHVEAAHQPETNCFFFLIESWIRVLRYLNWSVSIVFSLNRIRVPPYKSQISI